MSFTFRLHLTVPIDVQLVAALLDSTKEKTANGAKCHRTRKNMTEFSWDSSDRGGWLRKDADESLPPAVLSQLCPAGLSPFNYVSPASNFFFLPPTHSVIFCQWQALESSSLRPPSDRCLGCSSAVYRKYLNYSSHKGWALCIFFPSQLRNRKPCSIVACPRVMLIALSWLVFFRTMEINLM